jgi:hypothetical protein
MTKSFSFPLFIFLICFGQITLVSAQEFSQGKIEVRCTKDMTCNFYIQDKRIYSDGLDTTSQVRFWRAIMKLSPDSGIMNIASNRVMLSRMTVKEYAHLTEARKDSLRTALRTSYKLPETEAIFFSSGKNNFYNVEGVMPNIGKGIRIFENENTDPFYAQVIMLIESPGKCTGKSCVGAMGSFQLMKAVAKNMGLKVNKNVDERRDFDKSAWAAAKLIRTICIPYANKMLDEHKVVYDPSDLWYRLLVLHIYHAGAGNVARALDVINPCEGNISLIKQLWQTKAGNFGMASQNYSQVALANLIELDQIIEASGNSVHFVYPAGKTTGEIGIPTRPDGN